VALFPFYEFIKIDVTRIGAFVKETIALIILPGVDLNQEERYFLSGLIFLQNCTEGCGLTAENLKNKHEKCRLAV